jgi:hypothetical protein
MTSLIHVGYKEVTGDYYHAWWHCRATHGVLLNPQDSELFAFYHMGFDDNDVPKTFYYIKEELLFRDYSWAACDV